MKLLRCSLLLLLLLPACAHAQKGLVESLQLAEPPKIDGLVDEWNCEWLLEPSGKWAYNIANDQENLYLRMKITDNMTQAKIASFGLYVYLNPKGKKAGKIGFKFPVGKDADELKKRKNAKAAVTAEDIIKLKKDMLTDTETLELIGLSKQNLPYNRLGLMNGLEMMITANEKGDYLYEAKIPFKAYKIKRSDIKILGVKIETGEIPYVANNNAGANTTPVAGNMTNNAAMRGRYGYYLPSYSGSSYNRATEPAMMLIGVVLK